MRDALGIPAEDLSDDLGLDGVDLEPFADDGASVGITLPRGIERRDRAIAVGLASGTEPSCLLALDAAPRLVFLDNSWRYSPSTRPCTVKSVSACSLSESICCEM
jgi:hypothetical protein